jgi:hypothetical protein
MAFPNRDELFDVQDTDYYQWPKDSTEKIIPKQKNFIRCRKGSPGRPSNF